MIEVFKTNVPHTYAAEALSSELLTQLPYSKISFDLEDCDKILRIDSKTINPEIVITTLKKRGFVCEVLK